MPAHTPGPWIAKTGTANTSVYAGQFAVAVGCREADARLIAAAPRMLAVIQRIMEWEDMRMPLEIADDVHAILRDVEGETV